VSADDINPYSAPATAFKPTGVTIPFVKASRLRRLGAFAIDAALSSAPLLLFMAIAHFRDNPGQFSMSLIAGVGAVTLLAIAVFVVQVVLLVRNGWTIGKRALRIKIVRTNGESVDLLRALVTRMWLPGMLSMLPFCFIPLILLVFAHYVAWIPLVLWLVDPLLIFGRARRCGHDYIADTIVVKA
jgi:uncharacterized RDD family membrane protein YckC